MAAAGAVATAGPWIGPGFATSRKAKLWIVEISAFAFSPSALEIESGDRVRWINRDIVPHTATASDESWDTGALGSNESAEILFGAQRAETYFCRFHPMMASRLRVT
jgi:plastocyanin